MKDISLEGMEKCVQKKVSITESRWKTADVKCDRTKRELSGQGTEKTDGMKRTEMTERTAGMKMTEKTGKTRDECRYRMEEDENSIYEYDLNCLNEKGE